MVCQVIRWQHKAQAILVLYSRLVLKDMPWLQVTPYASDELVLIVPRHHELAKKSSIELGELQNLPLVSLNQV